MSQVEPRRAAQTHRRHGLATARVLRRQTQSRTGQVRRPANLPYAIVLAAVLGGLLWVWLSQTHVKGGLLVVGVSFLFAGAARLVLADERAGLLASRRRGIDIAAFAILGVGLVVAALLLKNPS